MEGKNHFKYAYELDVYKRLFSLSIVVITKVIPKLPNEEKYDLCDQMKRSSKAATAILSEGFPKRFQKYNWEKYITDTLGECEEMITHLLYVRELYKNKINPDSVSVLIEEYKHAICQLHALSKTWKHIKAINN
jgi:four helix bundle protein